MQFTGAVSVQSLIASKTPITPTTGEVIKPGKYPCAMMHSIGCATPFPIDAIAKNHAGKYAQRYALARPIADIIQIHSQMRLNATKKLLDHAARPSNLGKRSPGIVLGIRQENAGIAPLIQ
jgi:hypothetical protein